MDKPRIVHNQHRSEHPQRASSDLAPIGPVDMRFTAADSATRHQDDRNEIDAIPMGALRSGSTDPVRRVNAKLMRLDEATVGALHLCNQAPETRD